VKKGKGARGQKGKKENKEYRREYVNAAV